MTKNKIGYETPLKIGNHVVQVVEIGGAARLLVDGQRRPYIKAENGFTLREAIYEQPADSLLEAGKRLAERLAVRDSKSEGE